MISVFVKAKSYYTKYVEIYNVILNIMSDKSSPPISSLKYNNLT